MRFIPDIFLIHGFDISSVLETRFELMASRFLRFVHPPRLSSPLRLPLSFRRLMSPSTRINSFVIGPDFDLGSPSRLTFSTAAISFADDDASQSGDDGSYYSESDIKEGILDAALEFVPTHGWSREAIVEAAEKYGYPGVAHGTTGDLKLEDVAPPKKK